jgi:O-methyltransferase
LSVNQHAKQTVRRVLEGRGYELRRRAPDEFADLPAEVQERIRRVRPYTQTSPERLAAMCGAIDYITANKVVGDVVECGVWRGGTMMAAALTLLAHGDTSRGLWLYDTFTGMTKPTEHDVDLDGASQLDAWSDDADGEELQPGVESLLSSSGYPNLRFVRGPVEETIPGEAPDRIALLRLDTDWYESTRHELEHLWPRLAVGGVLIIDDYGHFAGARKAVDEYFAGTRIFLHRIDYTGRIAVKQA